MNDSWNNVKTVCCKPWLVLPTVYSDALSYGEQLDKFCYSLNKIIENNNILPDYISDKIKEYISSGAIGEVVREILANYILNVKYPPKGITPAIGDGSADDTEALQGCIDYASENGGVVYFPYGSYLTQPLTMKNGVSLFGFDRYSTKVVLKGGATKALLNGNGNNLSACNLTLDGNSGIQVNDVNVVDMTGSNLMFNDLVIKDGYKLFNFVGDGHLQLSNIVFGNAVENCFTVDGNVIVQTNNLLFTALSKVGGVSVVDIKANGGNYDFNSVAKCDTCMLISGNDNNVVAMIGGANEDYVDTGEHNNIEIVGHSQKEYYSGNIKKDANNSETTLQGTRSLHVVGTSTFAVDGNSTESVDGNKSEIVTGVTSETYKSTKTTKGTVLEETYTNKTTNAKRVILNTEDDLRYNKTPTDTNVFSYLPYFDLADNKYNLLVANEKTPLLSFLNAKLYGAKGDGVTDDTAVLQALLDSGEPVYIPSGTYIISDSLKATKNNIIVGDREGAYIVSKSTDNSKYILGIGSRCAVYNLSLSFSDTVDVSSANDSNMFVGLALIGEPYALERTGIYNVIIRHVGTGISDRFSPGFSVSYNDIEITDFSFCGMYLGDGSTGDLLNNIYINCGVKNPNTDAATLYKAWCGLYVKDNDALTVNSLNVEWCTFSYCAISFNNCHIDISSLHLEEVGITSAYTGIIQLDGTDGKIGTLSFFYPWMFTEGTALIELKKAGRLTSYAVGEDTSTILIDVLNLDGLNSPDWKTFPAITNKGLANANGWNSFFRNERYKDKNYIVTIEQYCYNSGNDDANNLKDPNRNPHDNIVFTKFGYIPNYGTLANRPNKLLCKNYSMYYSTNDYNIYLFTGFHTDTNDWKIIGHFNNSVDIETTPTENFSKTYAYLTANLSDNTLTINLQGNTSIIGDLLNINGNTLTGKFGSTVVVLNDKLYVISLNSNKITLSDPFNNGAPNFTTLRCLIYFK